VNISSHVDVAVDAEQPLDRDDQRGTSDEREPGERRLAPDTMRSTDHPADSNLAASGIRENLKLTPEQRLDKLSSVVRSLAELREAFVRSRR
jgi:hypothetical protein